MRERRARPPRRRGSRPYIRSPAPRADIAPQSRLPRRSRLSYGPCRLAVRRPRPQKTRPDRVATGPHARFAALQRGLRTSANCRSRVRARSRTVRRRGSCCGRRDPFQRRHLEQIPSPSASGRARSRPDRRTCMRSAVPSLASCIARCSGAQAVPWRAYESPFTTPGVRPIRPKEGSWLSFCSGVGTALSADQRRPSPTVTSVECLLNRCKLPPDRRGSSMSWIRSAQCSGLFPCASAAGRCLTTYLCTAHRAVVAIALQS